MCERRSLKRHTAAVCVMLAAIGTGMTLERVRIIIFYVNCVKCQTACLQLDFAAPHCIPVEPLTAYTVTSLQRLDTCSTNIDAVRGHSLYWNI